MKVDLKHTIKGALLGGVVLFTGTGVMGVVKKEKFLIRLVY